MTLGWTEDRKAKARARILQHRPWLKSTGPRTPAGKRRSAMNARKSGRYSQEARDLVKTIRSGSRFLRELKTWLRVTRERAQYVIAATQNQDGSWKFYFTLQPERWPAT